MIELMNENQRLFAEFVSRYDEMKARAIALEAALRHVLATTGPAAQGCSECDNAVALIISGSASR